MVSLEELVDAGLWSLFPQSFLEKTAKIQPKMGLYTLPCDARYGSGYQEEHAFTEEEVDMVFSCAKLFKSGASDSGISERPPLDLIIQLCCGKKRGEGHVNDPLLKRVKKLGYECKLLSIIAAWKVR